MTTLDTGTLVTHLLCLSPLSLRILFTSVLIFTSVKYFSFVEARELFYDTDTETAVVDILQQNNTIMNLASLHNLN